MKLNILLACTKSLICIIHNRGPRIEPCCKSVVIDNMFELILSICIIYTIFCIWVFQIDPFRL